jgi:hypothetical protein
LQDEAEATGAGEPFGDVLEERSRKHVAPPRSKASRSDLGSDSASTSSVRTSRE